MHEISVFISYSHDSAAHVEKVVGLSWRLRRDGIRIIFDRDFQQPDGQPEGWPHWMVNGIRQADYVVYVCTERYSRLTTSLEPGEGPIDAALKSKVVASELYQRYKRIVVVAFSPADAEHVPVFLSRDVCYILDSEDSYKRLLSRLHYQLHGAAAPAPQLSLPFDDSPTPFFWDRPKRMLVPLQRLFIERYFRSKHQQPAKLTDKVYFSVTAPAMVAAGTPFLFHVWAYLKKHRSEMLRRARKELGTTRLSVHSAGPSALSRDVVIKIAVSIPKLGFTDATEIYWAGSLSNASFMAAVPQSALYGLYPGVVKVLIAGLPIARLHFSVLIGARSAEAEDRTLMFARTKKVFASYATQDRPSVLARIQGMQKVLPNLDVFLDAFSLHSGEHWKQRLIAEILSRDAFYLFWSRFACKSEWVEREWRLAMDQRGLDFIDPVPLQPPNIAPPPPELASLHFNDWTLNIR